MDTIGEFEPERNTADAPDQTSSEPTTSPDSDLGGGDPSLPETDRRLIANGWEPVAVYGKRPVADAWQSRPNTIEAITAERAAHPYAISTGLRTGRASGVDVDLLPPEHAEVIKTLAFELLGETMLERVGAKGMMLVYRNETPIPKITIAGKHTTLTEVVGDAVRPLAGKVEILGVGQQFVAYGIHPEIGRDYDWVNSVFTEAEPLNVALADLPAVTPEKLREFADRVKAELERLGYRMARVGDHGDPEKRKAGQAKHRHDKDPVPKDYLVRMLGCIDVHQIDGDRVDWIRILGGIRATNLADVPEDQMDAELCEIADAWSRGEYSPDKRQPTGYEGQEDVEDAFYDMDPDEGSTFGTLYMRARESGWREPAPEDLDKKYAGVREWWETIGKHLPPGADPNEPEPTAESVGTAEDDDDDDAFRIFDTWEFKDRPEPKWQVDKLIRDKALTLIFGPSESYKTFEMIDILGSTATGLPAFGHFDVNRPGDTVLCLAEDPDDAMRGRFPAWCKSRGIADPFARPLLLPDGTPSPGRFVMIGDVPLVSDPHSVARLIASIKKAGLKPVHIAIDTAAKALGGLDQNNAQDVGLLVAAMTKLRREFDCAVTATHHPNKANPEEMRGSGAFTNDLDCIIHAQASAELVTVLKFQKLKGGAKPPAVSLRGSLYDVGLREAFPAFRFDRELGEKQDPKPEPSPVEGLRQRIIDHLRMATKNSGEWVDTGTLALTLWPPEPDEEAEDYAKRKAARMAELERYGTGNRGAGAGGLRSLVKKTRSGDPYKPTRWYLRADARQPGEAQPEQVEGGIQF